jgi:hypothetical protein
VSGSVTRKKMTDRWPPPVSERKEGERPLLGSAGLGQDAEMGRFAETAYYAADRPTKPRRRAGRGLPGE